MSWLRRLTLRWRMLAFGAVAFLPIVGLLAYQFWDDTRVKFAESRETAATLVKMVAAEQELRLALGQRVLATLALHPLVAAPTDAAACKRLLEQALAGERHLTGVSLFSAQGEAVCASSANLPPPIGDREYFRAALRTRQPVVSDYLVSLRSNQAVVALAHPVPGADGQVKQVLVAGLDLAWLARTLEAIPHPAKTNLVIVDGRGTVLAPEKWLGRSVADHPVFHRVAESGGQGTFEARGIDGVERVFVAGRLPHASGSRLYVWAAIDKDAIAHESLRGFLEETLWAFLAATFFFLLVWRAGSRLALAPIRALRRAARRMGESDLHARTGLPHEADEIGELATTFDEMAAAIETREESLLRANRALRVLSGGNQALVRAIDEAGLIGEICRVATREGGYRLAWIGRAEDDAARTLATLAAAGLAAPEIEALPKSWTEDDPNAGPAGAAVRENRPVAVHDAQALAPGASFWLGLAGRHDCRSLLALPIPVDGRPWGVLCLCAGHADAFDAAEIGLLAEMAADLGFGIETLRLRRHKAAARAALEHANSALEARVAERTADLERANRELESFSYSVSHDLRAPLRAMAGFADILHEDHAAQLDEVGREHLGRIRRAAVRMGHLIEDMLALAHVSRTAIDKRRTNFSALAREILDELAAGDAARRAEVRVEEGLEDLADPALLRVALQNLLENAWKYTSRRADARIEFGAQRLPEGGKAYFVRDNGCGFDMARAGDLFRSFVRLHGVDEYPGTGIGLATVARIVERHGGRVWAEAEKDKGATFRFTLA